MTLTGNNLINGKWASSPNTFTSNGQINVALATAEQVNEACVAARSAFQAFSTISRNERAKLLHQIADEIDALGDDVTAIAMQESGLPEARLVGERGRTTGQLRMFADVIKDKKYLDVRIDEALPERVPLARPDIRLTHRPIGPVVVFGASNFPLAFSTAGGDVASALAAGCPVIVKGHEAHPGTTELVARAIKIAIEKCNMPDAAFQLLQGNGHEVGVALVNHAEIRAVGFTGSFRGGRALFDQCQARPHPIPFYGELGSVNPIFCLPEAMKSRAVDMANGWVASLSLGAGQFCTNPGVVIALAGTDLDLFEATAIDAINATKPQIMLTDNIARNYTKGVEKISSLAKQITNNHEAVDPRNTGTVAFKTDAQSWLNTNDLQQEVFGACGIIVECQSVDDMRLVAEQMDGQLTVTLQLDMADHELAETLLPSLEEKAGRLLCNGFPTGVEVCSAMMHGGPYPASTDVRSTSVGTLAISRWLRPVSYQNFPSNLLHEELR